MVFIMMIYPPIAELVEKTGSRYTLVIEAAKRARQLSEGAEAMTKCDSTKEVSIATNEIYEDKLEVCAASDELCESEADVDETEEIHVETVESEEVANETESDDTDGTDDTEATDEL